MIAFEAAADEGVGIAVEGMHRGQRRLESGIEMFDTESESLAAEVPGGAGMGVERFVIGIEAGFVLEGDFTIKREACQITLGTESESVVVPVRLVAEIHQIGISTECESLDAGVGCVEQMAVGSQVLDVGSRRERAIGIGTENAVHLVEIGIIERQTIDGLIGQRDGIESLFVLTPADISDEGGVVINDALAAHPGGGFKTLVLQISLVELVGLRVGDDRVGGIKRIRTRRAAVIVIDGSLRELAFDEGAETIPSSGFEAEPLTDREGMGHVLAIDIGKLIAGADVDERGDPWSGRRRGRDVLRCARTNGRCSA